jgi:hypothetical protein
MKDFNPEPNSIAIEFHQGIWIIELNPGGYRHYAASFEHAARLFHHAHDGDHPNDYSLGIAA